MVPDPTGAQQLAETFAEISGVLLAEPDVQRTLDKMCALLVATVEGCNHAVVTVVHNQHLDSPAASDDVGPAVDAIQFEVHDGPCVEAIREHQTVVTDDLITETRWPQFARRAVEETGVRSMLAFRLFVAADTLGPSTSTPSNLGRSPTSAGGRHHLRRACLRRPTRRPDQGRPRPVARGGRDPGAFGEAKGILMGRRGISSEAATELLCRGAERLKIELRELARRVVQSEEGKRQGA